MNREDYVAIRNLLWEIWQLDLTSADEHKHITKMLITKHVVSGIYIEDGQFVLHKVET